MLTRTHGRFLGANHLKGMFVPPEDETVDGEIRLFHDDHSDTGFSVQCAFKDGVPTGYFYVNEKGVDGNGPWMTMLGEFRKLEKALVHAVVLVLRRSEGNSSKVVGDLR